MRRAWQSVALAVLLTALIPATGGGAMADGETVKAVLDARAAGENLLKPDGWRPWQKGFAREGATFVCDNAADPKVQRGASQTVVLNQTRPEPLVAVASSKAEGVGGSPNADYSLYLDLVYTDGTPLWGQTAAFSVGTHDWQRREVRVLPQKPVRSVSFHLLLRRHAGKAWFRGPELRVVRAPKGAVLFDGVPVTRAGLPLAGCQIRDVAASSDFVRIERQALGVRLETKESKRKGATLVDATLTDTTGKDRAVTFVVSTAIGGTGLKWHHDPRRSEPVESGREYVNAARFRVGSSQRLSRYPFAAVTMEGQGAIRTAGLGIDMSRPAFFRVGFNAGTGELFLAYDIGLTPEKPTARVRFVRFEFGRPWNFRAALARYAEIFEDHFRCRTPEQGLWMPFAKISAVEGWEDFGFKFKEGTNETKATTCSPSATPSP